MKKSQKAIFLTAAALILCLCGFFIPRIESCSQETVATVSQSACESFSVKKAKFMLNLSNVAHSEETLQKKLSAQGYGNFEYFLKEQSSGYSSGIAFGISTQISESSSEVIVVFRNTKGAEWYSNFHIGENTIHAGFASASSFSLEIIEDYFERHGINKAETSITLTGHSRGGAVANLVAKEFLDEGGFKSLCAYTFAAPNTTSEASAHSVIYGSIYNLVNPEDFICFLPLEAWGYTKYGQILSFPKVGDENYETLYTEMQNRYYKIANQNHSGYENGSDDVDTFLKAAETLSPTVYDYYRKKINLPSGSITLSEYMDKVASVLSKNNTVYNAMFIISSRDSEEVATLTNFMLQGITENSIKNGTVFIESAVYTAHVPRTYRSWLDVLDEDYFLSRLY